MKYNTPMNGFYNFTPELAFKEIEAHWKAWDAKVNPKTYVIGISGGVDSSCVAALACKIFGKERVVGVSLPCDGQSDMWAVDKLFETLDIKRMTVDIGDLFNIAFNAVENQAIEVSEVTRTNLPARLRMTMLYAISQSIGGIVVNTCNYSESCQGYDTLWGDNCGSYAPIQKLTKTEVKAIAAWLGLPNELASKTPIDGLQPLTDEEKLGITYDALDAYLRSTGPTDTITEAKILENFIKNRFKLEMVKLPGPGFEHLPNRIRANFGV